jgi:hypothetical protein
MMLQPNAPPPVFLQMEQKQNRNGTGVSDSTWNVMAPHWHEPSSRWRRFAAFGLVRRAGADFGARFEGRGMGTSMPLSGGDVNA